MLKRLFDRLKLRGRFRRVVGDERIRNALLMPGAKRSYRTRDRGVSTVGHPVEIRDDAANGQGLLCLQGWDSAHFETRGSYVHRLRTAVLGVHHSCPAQWRGAVASELGGALRGDQEPPRAIVASGSVSNGIMEQQESGKRGLWSTLCRLLQVARDDRNG